MGDNRRSGRLAGRLVLAVVGEAAAGSGVNSN